LRSGDETRERLSEKFNEKGDGADQMWQRKGSKCVEVGREMECWKVNGIYYRDVRSREGGEILENSRQENGEK
jgi:hypothetical protein